VHGVAGVYGATIFPHNVGLGATRNPELIREIGRITAREMAVAGLDWTFGPTVAVVRDDRWGRSYESWSEDPEIARAYAAAMVQGLQGEAGSAGFLGDGRVVACAKHFLGDGGTAGGVDRADNLASEAELRDLHGAGYISATEAGVQTVMASFSSWQGRTMHGNRELLTDVLKGRLGFDGFVVGDWNGHADVEGCSSSSCPAALNAGIDMFMVPEDWRAARGTIARCPGVIPMAASTTRCAASSGSRCARACSTGSLRAVRWPAAASSWDRRAPGGGAAGGARVAGAAQEQRRAAPAGVPSGVLVAGDGAVELAKQCGGWTLTWQGTDLEN
jgi:beta-glucosidase